MVVGMAGRSAASVDAESQTTGEAVTRAGAAGMAGEIRIGAGVDDVGRGSTGMD
jgi:hypothetical protein